MNFLEEIKNDTTNAIWHLNTAKIKEIRQTIQEFALAGKTQCFVNGGDNPEMIIRYFADLGFGVKEETNVAQEFSNLLISW